MGAISEAIQTYAQPLLDSTDGSAGEVQKALSIGAACWNLSLQTEEERNETLAKMQEVLKMNDEEFAAFRLNVVDPMIERHRQLFPRMHPRRQMGFTPDELTLPERPPRPPRVEKYPGTARTVPCPCGSGRKYKRCCARP